jgi:hypothetical protein
MSINYRIDIKNLSKISIKEDPFSIIQELYEINVKRQNNLQILKGLQDKIKKLQFKKSN